MCTPRLNLARLLFQFRRPIAHHGHRRCVSRGERVRALIMSQPKGKSTGKTPSGSDSAPRRRRSETVDAFAALTDDELVARVKTPFCVRAACVRRAHPFAGGVRHAQAVSPHADQRQGTTSSSVAAHTTSMRRAYSLGNVRQGTTGGVGEQRGRVVGQVDGPEMTCAVPIAVPTTLPETMMTLATWQRGQIHDCSDVGPFAVDLSIRTFACP